MDGGKECGGRVGESWRRRDGRRERRRERERETYMHRQYSYFRITHTMIQIIRGAT